MKEKIKSEWREFCALLNGVPAVITTLFVMAVFSMNLLANKSITLPWDWLALDCGIIVSWFVFFTMDIVTKHFGPKAGNELTVLAIIVNASFCLILFIGSVIPGMWGEAYVEGSENLLNGALNNTFGGTWYVVLGSTAAFLISAIVNNFTNFGVGKLFKRNPDGITAFICRTYVSTAIGQFIDNLVFALIVSHFFFGWTILQCVTCALTGMLAELLCEGVFFYPAYKITARWKRDCVGKEYFALREGKNEGCDNGNE